MATFHEVEAALSDLVLDPDNYRFQDSADFVSVSKDRFAEPTVQDRALKRLQSFGLRELKDSISFNGYLTFEKVIVAPYPDNKYLVLEGNRRVAAMKLLQSDHEAGVTVPEGLRERFLRFPVLLVEGLDNEPELRLSLMGIRHVGGIKEWGAFQRAQLVTELRDVHELDTPSVAARLGMTAHEVNRRYRAYKALQQMMEDEEFSDRATPNMYPLFHEAVAGSVVKEWLGWNEADSCFDNGDELHKFYSLLVETELDNGEMRSPKIASREAVRDLREVLPVPEARRRLLDENSSYADALALAKAEELAQSWAAEVSEAVVALRKVGALELRHMPEEDIRRVRELRDLATELLTLHSLYSRPLEAAPQS